MAIVFLHRHLLFAGILLKLFLFTKLITVLYYDIGNASSQEFDGEKAVIGVSKEAREAAVRNSELEGDQQHSNANSKHVRTTFIVQNNKLSYKFHSHPFK